MGLRQLCKLFMGVRFSHASTNIFHSSTAVVQLTVNQLVVGSIPACGANIGDVMELVYVLVLEAKFCEFESHRPHQFALLV